MLEAGSTEIGNESPLETRAQPVMEMAHGPGYAVAAEDNLLAGLMQSVEGVEKLLFRGLFTGDELHIIYQQDIHGPVVSTERVSRALPDRLDDLVGKSLGCDIGDGQSLLLSEVTN